MYNIIIYLKSAGKNFFKNRKLSRPLSHFTPRIQRTTRVIYISNHLSMLQRASKKYLARCRALKALKGSKKGSILKAKP